MRLHGNEEHLNIDKNHKTIYIKSIHRLIEVLWKLLNFMAGFLETSQLPTGAVGTTRHIQKRSTPRGLRLVCAAYSPQHPDTVSTLAGLPLCPANARLRWVYGGIGISNHPLICPPIEVT